jgi:beta-glucosidase
VVLLKNDKCLLPLSPKTNVLVAGDGANDIGKQSGGWSLTWQGTGNTNADFPGATSIYDGISAAVSAAGGSATLSVDGSFQAKPDAAIVVFGESPYAEWHGDIKSIEYRGPVGDGHPVDINRPAPEVSPLFDEPNYETSAETQPVAPVADLALLKRLRDRGIPVVAVFLTGRVRAVTPEIEASNAFAVAWLPGTEGGGIADVLFRTSQGAVNFPLSGKLSYAWPRSGAGGAALFPYGYGLGGCNQH